MYLARRRYTLDPARVDEVARGAQGVVPLVRAVRGFVAYYLVKTADGASSISVFETRAQVDESNVVAAEYIKQHLAAALPNPPQVIPGEVLVYAHNPAAAANKDRLYVVRRDYTVPGSIDRIAQQSREGFVPIISQAPGFVEYFVVRTPAGLSSLTFFEEQAQAEESTPQAVQWLKENLAGLVPNPADVRVGEVVLHAHR
ncbi:MAG: hypothetical protein HY329_00650 [Chloroflexi bacterium]|nr:hypothetical protein [Chloroflexota bacterium]